MAANSSMAFDEHIHPLFSDGLPTDFRTNPVIKALASVESGADIAQGEPAAPDQSSMVDLPPESSLMKTRSGKYRDLLAAKARAKIEMMSPYSRGQHPRGNSLKSPSSNRDNNESTASALAPAANSDVDAAELSILMGLWKPTGTNSQRRLENANHFPHPGGVKGAGSDLPMNDSGSAL